MVIVVFRSQVRPDADMQRLDVMGLRMYEIASGMPGFISYKDFTAEDGEALTLVEFEDEASLIQWRDHPEHLAVQEDGRANVFESYAISVCEPRRRYAFERERGRYEL